MVDLLSIIPTTYHLVKNIIDLVETIRDNREECKRLLEAIGRVSINVAWLEQMRERTTKKSDGHQMMSGALMGLKETLERSHKIILDCHENRGLLMRAIKAADAANKLQQISDDISSNMIEAMFATVACTFALTAEMDADVKKLVQAVHARDTASIRSKLPSLSKQIVEALPDLRTQVTESVRIYSTSIRYQNKEKMEANKTKVQSLVKTIIENNNVPVDHRTSLASLSDGSANKCASVKSVDGQGRPKDALQSSSTAVSLRSYHQQRQMGPEKTSSNEKVELQSSSVAVSLRSYHLHRSMGPEKISSNEKDEPQSSSVAVSLRSSHLQQPMGPEKTSSNEKDKLQSSSVAVSLRSSHLQRPMGPRRTSNNEKNELQSSSVAVSLRSYDLQRSMGPGKTSSTEKDELQSPSVAVSLRSSHLQRPIGPGKTSSNEKDELQSSSVAVSLRSSHLQRPMEHGKTSSNEKQAAPLDYARD